MFTKILQSSKVQWVYAILLFIAFAGQYLSLKQSIHDFAMRTLIILALPMILLVIPLIKAMLAGGVKGYQNNQAWRSRT